MIIYGGYHHINKIGEFLQFSSKRKGIRAWNFRMMIRKIWQFLWYQNRNNFEKNEKRKEQAPLIQEKFARRVTKHTCKPGGGTQIIFWQSVRPEVWNPYPYIRIFLTKKNGWIDISFFFNFCKSRPICKDFSASKTAAFTIFLQILWNGTLL